MSEQRRGRNPGSAWRKPSQGVRKRIEFDAESYQALDLLARDTMKSLQELADEAFNDLLKKYHRPVTLKQALKESARQIPANDPAPRARAAAKSRRR